MADRIKIAFAYGRLSVKTTVSGGKRGSVAITIDLPSESRLITYLAHSDVQADGPLGEGPVRLSTSGGRLSIGHATADLDLESARGAVHDLVSALTAQPRSAREVRVHARTRRGDVVVRRSAG